MGSSSASFPRSHRLLKADEFTAVLRQSDVNKSAGPLRMRARKNRMRDARLGLVVGKKGNRTAVRRNRIKRLVRDSFRQRSGTLSGYDIVIQVFAEIEDERLKRSLEKMFTELANGSDKGGAQYQENEYQ